MASPYGFSREKRAIRLIIHFLIYIEAVDMMDFGYWSLQLMGILEKRDGKPVNYDLKLTEFMREKGF